MASGFNRYLRTFRKRCGLSQREVALLVGLETGQIISRHEGKTRMPNLRVAIAYTILFDAPLRTLFPELHQETEEILLTCALALRAQLQKERRTQRSRHKQKHLDDLIRRLDATFL